MKTLLMTAPLPAAEYAAAVHAVDPTIDLVLHDDTLDAAALAACEAVLAWRLLPGVVARMPRLRWVCAVSAGVDKLLDADLAPQVEVSRIVDPAQALAIAQFVATMALRHAREIERYAAQQRLHQWRRRGVGALDCRVTVLGMGATGAAIAAVLDQIGFAVRGWRRSDGESLAGAVAGAAIVVCALPLTAATRGLLGAAAFAAMARGAYLINIARGEHVVEADLIAAVRSGQLAGAALDVQAHEPMAPDDPLWDVAGITITPHIAGQSQLQTVAEQFVAGLRCVERGLAPPNRVDRGRGY